MHTSLRRRQRGLDRQRRLDRDGELCPGVFLIVSLLYLYLYIYSKAYLKLLMLPMWSHSYISATERSILSFIVLSINTGPYYDIGVERMPTKTIKEPLSLVTRCFLAA